MNPVPSDLRRQIEFHRSRPGRRRNYPRKLKEAAVDWARPQLDTYSVRTLSDNLGVGWDTLKAWIVKLESSQAVRNEGTADSQEDPVFLPVRVVDAIGPASAECSSVEVVVRGGRSVRVQWPSGATVLADVVSAVEAIP